MKKVTTIKVHLKKRRYPIIIGYKQFDYLVKEIKKINPGNHAVIITNPKIKKLYGKKLISSLKKSSVNTSFITVPDSEKSKSITQFNKVVSKIIKTDIRKKIFIVALGGGVVGDLAGFVAAVYKRGIPYIQIPTTLLAQVDSSIGGKVAIDLPEAKNMVGAFYQPSLVYSDISLLSTLRPRDILSGLSEVIKYGVIADSELFKFIEHNYYKILEFDKSSLNYIITSSAKIKAGIVSEDEKEQKGRRTILNFGHTIAHAIETACDYSKDYTHGEAVAVGMVCAADIAKRLNLCNKKTLSRLESLISRVGLPVHIKAISLNKIMNSYLHDKKFISGKNRFVLPLKIGRVEVVEDVNKNVIKEVIEKRICK